MFFSQTRQPVFKHFLFLLFLNLVHLGLTLVVKFLQIFNSLYEKLCVRRTGVIFVCFEFEAGWGWKSVVLLHLTDLFFERPFLFVRFSLLFITFTLNMGLLLVFQLLKFLLQLLRWIHRRRTTIITQSALHPCKLIYFRTHCHILLLFLFFRRRLIHHYVYNDWLFFAFFPWRKTSVQSIVINSESWNFTLSRSKRKEAAGRGRRPVISGGWVTVTE